MFKNALVSCSNKTGLVEFLRPYMASGLRIVSTGGTAQHLRENKIPVVEVVEQTGFPEVMDGRVKTLHPHVHMALLARLEENSDRETLERYKIQPFDLVIGNLYPFESDPSEDTIDIGGPSFLRAAAKSFSRITVICDPEDYQWISQKAELTLDDRKWLAAKLYSHTSTYDAMIAKFYGGEKRLQFKDLSLGGKFIKSLRYGENPSQPAAWYRSAGGENGIHRAEILQGKELSYNNILDIEAAVSTLRDFAGSPAAIAVKHNNPCGVATDFQAAAALKKCMEADPQSIFGGILAVNFALDEKMAESLNSVFLECILAPKIEEPAKAIFSKKKNLRVLQWPGFAETGDEFCFRSISGGFLVQSRDRVETEWQRTWQVLGNEINAEVRSDLLLAWKVAAHLKSNAIAIAKNGQSLGLGMGQVNRVDAVQQAIERAHRFHAQVHGGVLASDAFFPFADSIEKIAAAGIRHVIQPGGSVKDEEVKQKARELGVNMVLTGTRHFAH